MTVAVAPPGCSCHGFGSPYTSMVRNSTNAAHVKALRQREATISELDFGLEKKNEELTRARDSVEHGPRRSRCRQSEHGYSARADNDR